MENICLLCITTGIILFITILLGKWDSDNPLFMISVLVCIGFCVIILLVPLVSSYSNKTEEVKNFEYHKFTGYTCIVIDNKLWNYTEASLFNVINKDSNIKVKIYFNFYGSEVKRNLIIDDKEY